MPREDLTDINFVLDRSGSMDKIKDDTIGGFNRFLKDQQAEEGEATMGLYQFDDEYEVVYTGVPIKDVKPLDDKTFVPRGWTRLLDAIGKTIITVGERLNKMNEEDKPGKVLFVILTDGKENDSREYKEKSDIFNMIDHQRTIYNWEFIFLGAKQDAIAVGQSLGFMASRSMTFAKTGKGTGMAYDSLSRGVSAYRHSVAGQSASFFSDEDRKEQEKEKANE